MKEEGEDEQAAEDEELVPTAFVRVGGTDDAESRRDDRVDGCGTRGDQRRVLRKGEKTHLLRSKSLPTRISCRQAHAEVASYTSASSYSSPVPSAPSSAHPSKEPTGFSAPSRGVGSTEGRRRQRRRGGGRGGRSRGPRRSARRGRGGAGGGGRFGGGR